MRGDFFPLPPVTAHSPAATSIPVAGCEPVVRFLSFSARLQPEKRPNEPMGSSSSSPLLIGPSQSNYRKVVRTSAADAVPEVNPLSTSDSGAASPPRPSSRGWAGVAPTA